MRIAVDGMGGDYAPEEIVKGSVIAAREYGVQIILAGPSERMKQELAKHDLSGAEIEVVHAGEYLVEGEPPAYALRQKRDASVAVATKLVREGKADAVVSAVDNQTARDHIGARTAQFGIPLVEGGFSK